SCDAEEEQPVAENVAGEGGGRSEAQDDPPGERRADKEPELAIGGADRDRRRQSARRDEARQQPVARRDGERMRRAVDRRERCQRMDRQRAGNGKPGQDRGLGRRASIADHENAQPVPPVREHAPNRHQDDVRGRIGKSDDRQPRGRMGEVPGGPRHRDRLHKEAQPRNDRAERIPAKITVRESLGDTPQAETHAAPWRAARIRAMTLRKASAKRSTSASSDAQPKLSRIAPRARSGFTPIAASTCDGATLPDEQAEPELTATPARSSAITSVAASTPGTAKQRVLGKRGAASEKTTASAATERTAAARRSRRPTSRGASLSVSSRDARAAAPKPAIA